ncbi:hypothetical protein N4S67_18890 [Mycobacterium sp. CPCC 205710]|uniref:Secreted protein n=2 Tax=Mycobacterium deserti TaxID=2978347 RepID=A0ABT2MGI8_9MYCO|nr:hypothetical protein [Mycobacterium deserti]MCT7660475.1 hypothetical protein [Mycobacterium deserti]
MTTMNATKLALIATATTVASLALPATAHAEPSQMFQFVSPSGNIACEMDEHFDGTAEAWCKIRDHSWAAPTDTICPVANVTGAIGEPADDFQLRQGRAACTGFVMNQIFFSGPYLPGTLAYGQTHTVGPITCASEPSGVTCSDSSTGHLFRVSQESYQLG